MKILLLRVAYAVYVEQFYAARPELAEQPYATQEAALIADGFDWWDLWADGLRAQGHEAREYAVNVPPLQQAWASEHGIAPSVAADEDQLALAQVRDFAPEVLLLLDHHAFSPAWIAAARAACPGLRLVAVWCSAPYSSLAVFKAVDLVLSCSLPMVEEFRRQGLQSAELSHGFGIPALARLQPPRTPPDDVTFVGQLTRGKSGHLERERLLEEVVQAFPQTLIFSPSALLAPGRDLRQALLRQAVYAGVRASRLLRVPPAQVARLPGLQRAAYWSHWPMRQVNPRLRPYLRPPVYGTPMLQALRDSRVTLNTHIAASGAFACNMRLFEATGVGTCLVTDWKDNLPQLFVPDEEVVTYRSPAECVDKVRHLLAHPALCQQIAAAGQARVRRDHQIAQRMVVLAQIMLEYLHRGAA